MGPKNSGEIASNHIDCFGEIPSMVQQLPEIWREIPSNSRNHSLKAPELSGQGGFFDPLPLKAARGKADAIGLPGGLVAATRLHGDLPKIWQFP